MRNSSFERLVGAKGASEKDKDAFITQVGNELFESAKTIEVAGEIPKTPEQIKICNEIDKRVSEIVAQYGGHDFSITPEHVRITNDPKYIFEEAGAQFLPEKQ